MCVKPEALLSGLVSLHRNGRDVSRQELETLLAAGCSREALRAAFVGLPGEGLAAEIAGVQPRGASGERPADEI